MNESTSDQSATRLSSSKSIRDPQSPMRWSPKRIGWRLGRIVGLIYLGLCILLFAFQDYLIFPGRNTQGAKHAVIRESTEGHYELVRLTTSRGDKTVAYFGSAQDANGQRRADASAQPTMLFFYGNGMCLSDCIGLVHSFQKLGINVLGAEYVGYGMSTGKSSETTLYETADACWDHLQTRTDIDRNKIILAGWSLGGAVAIDSATRRPAIGLITFSAFTSMNTMARRTVPWLPTSLMLRHRFENLEKIRRIRCPIFIAHGTQDRIIPFEMCGELARAAKRSPRVTTIALDSDHNDVFETQEAVYEPLQKFIDSLW
ncbi:MAG: alpha/beta hydrolase [Anaerolineae bacterium]|nr:alpha/beta hydrolase [Phycisphaerae bacterium]